MKEIALEAADAAFREGVKTAATNLVSNWLLASTDDERQKAVERHKLGLRLWKEAHEATVAALGELFG